ncbi:MAG: 50S ribosomal protein L24 [bacterium]|nr:50S ribosomal protein L24 [bacterium]
MAGLHVKKNDVVQVVSGANRGKTGKVLRALHDSGRVIVEGLNFRKKHTKPSRDNQQGGIVQKEGSISVSNVLLYCPSCKKGVKTKHEVRKDGTKTRVCRKCGEVFDKA